MDYNNTITKIALDMANEYDEFMMGCFKQFGITRYNIFMIKDKITLEDMSYSDIQIKKFYYDGSYMFTITIYNEAIIKDDSKITKNIKFVMSTDDF